MKITDKMRLDRVLEAARRFIPHPKIIQWEAREVELRDAFRCYDVAIRAGERNK